MNMLVEGLSRYLSSDQLALLRQARVAILGAGGLGSNVAMMLARSGIGEFLIVDYDLVDPSNLNRQSYFPDDVDKPKTEVLAAYLRRLNPDVVVLPLQERLTELNCAEVVEGYPIVVEAVDDAVTKATLYEHIVPTGCFYVGASGMGGLGGGPEHTMRERHIGANVVYVGDFVSNVDAATPPLAPRVIQAAALQAGAVLRHILAGTF